MNICFASNLEKLPFKYVMNTVYPWSWACRDLNNFQRWLLENKNSGVNVIRLAVPWNLVEKEKGKYRFGWFSKRVNLVRKYGFKLQIILDTFDAPSWILSNKNYFQKNENHKIIEFNIGRVRSSFLNSGSVVPAVPSFYSAEYWEYVVDFYKAVCLYVNNHGIDVIAFSSAWDEFLESEYSPLGWGGYEAPGRQKFVLWLRNRYGNLTNLNKSWKTDLKGWDEISLPRPRMMAWGISGPRQDFSDWLQFRTVILKSIYDKLSDAVKGINKNFLYGVQWGSSGFYRNGLQRGTVRLSYLSKGLDWIFSGAQGEDPHLFVDGVLRCSVDKRIEISREIDAPYPLNKEGKKRNYVLQIKEAKRWFDSIDFANWDSQKAYHRMLGENLLKTLIESGFQQVDICRVYKKNKINLDGLLLNPANFKTKIKNYLNIITRERKNSLCECFEF